MDQTSPKKPNHKRISKMLARCHKQLTNTNISIFITIDVVCQMLGHMTKLQQFINNHSDPHGTATATAAQAQRTIEAVLDRLNISNPQYASQETIKRNANNVKSQLIAQIIKCMGKTCVEKRQQKRIKEGLKAQLDGSKDNAVSVRDLPLVRGLLTGKTLTEVMTSISTPEETLRMRKLLQDMNYEHLRQFFAPLRKWKSLQRPQDLIEQINTGIEIRNTPSDDNDSRADQKSTTDEPLPDSVNNSSLQEAQSMVLSNGGSKQSGINDFISLVDQRLQSAGVANRRRKRLIHHLSSCLAGQSFTLQNRAEDIFLVGLLTGRDAGMMFQQCETVEENQALSGIVAHLDLSELQVGRDWVFDENGVLVRKAGLIAEETLRIAAAGARSLRTHVIVPEEHEPRMENQDADADNSLGMDCDGMDLAWGAAKQLHLELANAIAEGGTSSRLSII